jgi:hypothetical protein
MFCKSVYVYFQLPFTLNAAFEFPKLVAFKFSPLLLLTSGGLSELPTLQEFIHTLRPTANPLEWIPPYTGMRPYYLENLILCKLVSTLFFQVSHSIDQQSMCSDSCIDISRVGCYTAALIISVQLFSIICCMFFAAANIHFVCVEPG